MKRVTVTITNLKNHLKTFFANNDTEVSYGLIKYSLNKDHCIYMPSKQIVERLKVIDTAHEWQTPPCCVKPIGQR